MHNPKPLQKKNIEFSPDDFAAIKTMSEALGLRLPGGLKMALLHGVGAAYVSALFLNRHLKNAPGSRLSFDDLHGQFDLWAKQYRGKYCNHIPSADQFGRIITFVCNSVGISVRVRGNVAYFNNVECVSATGLTLSDPGKPCHRI